MPKSKQLILRMSSLKKSILSFSKKVLIQSHKSIRGYTLLVKLKICKQLFQRISVCYRLNRGKLASPNVSSQLAPLVAFVTPHSTNTAIPPTNAIPLSLSSSSTSSGLFVEAYYIEYLWQ